MRRTILAVSLVVVFLTVIAGAGTATDNCRMIDGKQACIQNSSLSDGEITLGTQTELTVQIHNPGDVDVTPRIILNINGPNNQTDVYQLRGRSLSPGESTAIRQSLNASTKGTHSLQILLQDRTGQRYDWSQTLTVEVRSEKTAELGGRIDRPEIALAALVLSVIGILGIGYRMLSQRDTRD